MPMAMAVWMLLTRAPRWWHGPLIILLTLLAIVLAFPVAVLAARKRLLAVGAANGLLLVRGTSLSVVPDPSITGSFIGELKNVTVRQAQTLSPSSSPVSQWMPLGTSTEITGIPPLAIA